LGGQLLVRLDDLHAVIERSRVVAPFPSERIGGDV
jgi:hypothetical protein